MFKSILDFLNPVLWLSNLFQIGKTEVVAEKEEDENDPTDSETDTEDDE